MVFLHLIYAIALIFIVSCWIIICTAPFTYCLMKSTEQEEEGVICNYESYSTTIV